MRGTEIMSEERTLVLIKPDGVARGLMGKCFLGWSERATESQICEW